MGHLDSQKYKSYSLVNFFSPFNLLIFCPLVLKYGLSSTALLGPWLEMQTLIPDPLNQCVGGTGLWTAFPGSLRACGLDALWVSASTPIEANCAIS
jgi:hypothetical protein